MAINIMIKMKIAGVSVCIWILGVGAIIGSISLAVPKKAISNKDSINVSAAQLDMPLEVVQDALRKSDSGICEVRGKIHNPRSAAARYVTISYNLMVGDIDENNELIHTRKGTARAKIHYLPPGETLEFTAYADTRFERHEHPIFEPADIAEMKSTSGN